MKTTRKTDVAKFFCGFETFHALGHGYFWLSGHPDTFLGITAVPAWNMVGTLLNAAIAIFLGLYAWGGKPTAPPQSAAE